MVHINPGKNDNHDNGHVNHVDHHKDSHVEHHEHHDLDHLYETNKHYSTKQKILWLLAMTTILSSFVVITALIGHYSRLLSEYSQKK